MERVIGKISLADTWVLHRRRRIETAALIYSSYDCAGCSLFYTPW